MSEILEMSAVHKSYGEGTPVLNGATFSIHPGDRTFLVGPSGSGKSTILNIAAGLVKADSGSVKASAEWISVGQATHATRAAPRAHRLRVSEVQPGIRTDGRRERHSPEPSGRKAET